MPYAFLSHSSQDISDVRKLKASLEADSETIYQLLVQNYSLLFTVSRQEASVTILRVLYSASDLAARLSD